jgi:hypothetical protein
MVRKGLSLLLASFATTAIALPAPVSVSGDIFFNLSPPAPARVQLSTFDSVALEHASFGSLALSIAPLPSPIITASAAIGPSSTPGLFGRAVGTVTYSLKIVGADGLVPLLIGVAGAAAGTAGEGASFVVQSRWELADSFSGVSLAADLVSSGQMSGSFSEHFNHVIGATLATNHAYSIFMLADAEAAATAIGSRARAEAVIDPVFSFAEGVNTEAYAFEFSEGIGNMSAIPEPSALVLLFGGAVVLSTKMRRRPV